MVFRYHVPTYLIKGKNQMLITSAQEKTINAVINADHFYCDYCGGDMTQDEYNVDEFNCDSCDEVIYIDEDGSIC